MIPNAQLRRLCLAVLCASLLGACANSYPSRTLTTKETTLDRPSAQPADSELLSVRIEAFDPGKLPDDPKLSKGLSTDIRNAEAYYVPSQLKETMQKSGHWGPVRVTPRDARGSDVNVSGKILESDGEILKIEVQVRDASGAHWFTKEYENTIDVAAYWRADSQGVDAFQNLYNEVANDIVNHRKKLKPENHTEIRQVADLRFGGEFAPVAYDGYLKKYSDPEDQKSGVQRAFAFLGGRKESEWKPTYQVVRLPPKEDPVVQRVERIRAREEMLIDTFDQQYETLVRSVKVPYNNWRTSRLKEIEAIREADRVKNSENAKAVAVGVLGVLAGAAVAAGNRGGNCYSCTAAGGAIAGAGVAIAVQMAERASIQAESETNMRRAALEELGNTMSSDVKPTVLEVEGKTVELKGTIEQQFNAWRDVLKDLRDSETAPLQKPTAPQAAPTVGT